MKKYEVYSHYGSTILSADRVERVSVNDKPQKILFIRDDEIVAEFFAERICGWAEIPIQEG